MKVVVGGVFAPGITDLFLENFPKDIEVEIDTNLENLKTRTDIEVFVTRGFPVTTDFIERNKNLKFVQKWGSGLDNMDLEAAGKRGIPICNVPGANSYAVAELAVMLMLAVYRNLLYHNEKMKAGVWTKTEHIEQTYCLKGKTVGIIGGGHVGRLVAKAVQAFNAKTVYFDVYRMEENLEKELNMQYMPMDDLLKVADVVTLHIPLLPSTKNIMSKAQFDLMKPTSILINTARGALVNEADLLEALNNNKILGAGLDCICNEKDKLNANDPILHNEKITVTPHVGGTSNDLGQEMVPRMAANAVRFIRGEQVLSVTNSEFIK